MASGNILAGRANKSSAFASSYWSIAGFSHINFGHKNMPSQ
jgi:hypothetical protein